MLMRAVNKMTALYCLTIILSGHSTASGPVGPWGEPKGLVFAALPPTSLLDEVLDLALSAVVLMILLQASLALLDGQGTL